MNLIQKDCATVYMVPMSLLMCGLGNYCATVYMHRCVFHHSTLDRSFVVAVASSRHEWQMMHQPPICLYIYIYIYLGAVSSFKSLVKTLVK